MAINWFPLWLSLRVAALATLVSLVFGLWIAYMLANRNFRGKELLDAVVMLPLVLPPTVLGYYLLVVLGRSSPIGHLYEWAFGTPLVFTWQAAVVASTFHAIPLLVKSARAAFRLCDSAAKRFRSGGVGMGGGHPGTHWILARRPARSAHACGSRP